jgi:hypothetical protein
MEEKKEAKKQEIKEVKPAVEVKVKPLEEYSSKELIREVIKREGLTNHLTYHEFRKLL